MCKQTAGGTLIRRQLLLFIFFFFFLLAMERGYVRELDLSNCGPASVATRVGVVPGLRSSAGKPGIFFTFFFSPDLSSFST